MPIKRVMNALFCLKNLFRLSLFSFFAILAACASTASAPSATAATSAPPAVSAKTTAIEEPKKEENPVSCAVYLEYREAANGFADEISIETYKNDKKELEKMVVNLNDIVKKADFDTWQAFLSNDSRDYWSNQSNLRRVSAIYRSQGIVLHSLEDYFRRLVVNSRIDRQMGKIAYVSKDYIKVFEANQEKNVIFYEFVRTGGGDWKIKLREM